MAIGLTLNISGLDEALNAMERRLLEAIMTARDDLIREQGETDDAIAVIEAKVDAAVQLIADLKAALVAATNGLTAAEAAALAANLDAGQAKIAAIGAKLDSATAPDAPPPA